MVLAQMFLRQIKDLPRISSNAQCLVVMWKRNDPMLIPSFTFFMVLRLLISQIEKHIH